MAENRGMRHQYRQFHSQAVLITKAGAGVDSGRKGEAAKLSFVAIFRLGRDGGTGRRSGLKIRRGLSPRGGSTPPPGTIIQPIHTQLVDLRNSSSGRDG